MYRDTWYIDITKNRENRNKIYKNDTFLEN